MARSLSPPSRSPRRSRFARPQLEVLEDRCLLSAGQLDPTFGLGGRVNTDIGGPTNNGAQAVVVAQPDGKVVVLGSYYDYAAGGNRTTVARYNPDGSLDAGFGSSGEVVFNFAEAPSYNADFA